MRKQMIFGLAAMVSLTSSALAPPLVETEPNNTLATADVISTGEYDDGAFAFDGGITLGDVDYISFDLTLGDFVGATLFHFPLESHDSLLGLFNPAGVLVMSSSDLSSFFSLLEFTADATGTWSLAVSGDGDADFDGSGHSEAFNYKLVVGINPIPAPASLSLLGLASLLGRRRRRA